MNEKIIDIISYFVSATIGMILGIIIGVNLS